MNDKGFVQCSVGADGAVSMRLEDGSQCLVQASTFQRSPTLSHYMTRADEAEFAVHMPQKYVQLWLELLDILALGGEAAAVRSMHTERIL